MTRLPALLASYAGYHRNPLNKATHFVGVPMIVFAIMIPMSLTRVPALGDWPVRPARCPYDYVAPRTEAGATGERAGEFLVRKRL